MNLPAAPSLTLGPDCDLRGELTLSCDVMLMGKFEGTLRVAGTLDIAAGAQLRGRIVAHAVNIRPGAEVRAEIATRALADSQKTLAPAPSPAPAASPVAASRTPPTPPLTPPSSTPAAVTNLATVPDVLQNVLTRRRIRVLAARGPEVKAE